MEQLILFHDYRILIITTILSVVFFLIIKIVKNFFFRRNILENQIIELIWTLIPTVVLRFIALPSLHLLYLIDELYNPLLTIKILGHQWYWSYEYNDFRSIEFDSYIAPSRTLRLLEVDNSTPIPLNCQTRLITSSNDVLHSWTIPAIGIKIDATPGRLNQISLFSNRTGRFFGQCSEICGTNHSFIPIVVDIIPVKYFISWIKNFNLFSDWKASNGLLNQCMVSAITLNKKLVNLSITLSCHVKIIKFIFLYSTNSTYTMNYFIDIHFNFTSHNFFTYLLH